jgi:quinol monooxygenase YgiN
MKSEFISACVLATMITGAVLAQPVPSQPVPSQPVPSQPVYIVAYVDVLASAAPRAAAVLTRYRAAIRGEPGALRIDLYSQKGRASGFAIVEVWRDGAAYDTHLKSAAIERLRRDLQPLQLAPMDARIQTAYSVHPPMTESKNAVTLLVHVDVIPTFLADYERIAKSYIQGTQAESGLLGLNVLQTLPPHPNHLTVIERWIGTAALESHQQTSTARTYREALNPMLGALYDERIYRKVD